MKWSVVNALLLLLLFTTLAYAQTKPAATPRDTLHEYVQAVTDRKLDQVKNLIWQGDKSELTMLEVMSKLAIAESTLGDSAKDKWGDEAPKVGDGPISKTEELKQLMAAFDVGTTEITGDTAEIKMLADTKHPERHSPVMFFKQTDGQWKIDSERTYAANGQPKNFQTNLKYTLARAEALEKTAAAIKDGTLKTVPEFKAYLRTALSKAEEVAMPSATQPKPSATQPQQN